MTLCVCGHPSEQHHQYDAGWYCESCPCDWLDRETADSEESTASLLAGVTPEGLAGETVSESVNDPTDEARAPDEVVCTRQEHRAWSKHRHHGAPNADESRAPEQTVEPPRTVDVLSDVIFTLDNEFGEDAPDWAFDLADRVRAAIEREAEATEQAMLAAFDDVQRMDRVEREAAAVAAPPLDVELLARAAEATEKYQGDGVIDGRHPFLVADRFSWRKWAAYQAAEYARLSQPSPDDR